MPRRKLIKCPERNSGPTLDAIVEFSCTEWGGLPNIGLDFEELEKAWMMHREYLISEYKKQLCGQLPFAEYACHAVELPEPVRQPYPADPPYTTRNGLIHSYPIYFETQEAEFRHLDRLGLIDPDEKKLAIKRFKASTEWKHYKSVVPPVTVTTTNGVLT